MSGPLCITLEGIASNKVFLRRRDFGASEVLHPVRWIDVANTLALPSAAPPDPAVRRSNGTLAPVFEFRALSSDQ